MDDVTLKLMTRIAEALERLAPPPPPPPPSLPAKTHAFIWHADPPSLQPVKSVAVVGLPLLKGIERQKAILLENTLHFARGLPANNAMLWGVRGMGKSSLVKAIHQHVVRDLKLDLALVEIRREQLDTLPDLLHVLQHQKRRCLVFCDDLSFEQDDISYKILKSVLDGSISGRPANVVFYATSNRRHLISRNMIDNERSTAVNPAEAAEEKLSLSDRFGIWIGFHACDQNIYHDIVVAYAKAKGLPIEDSELLRRANEWSVTRGGRSGRIAWQFIQDLSGQLGS